MRKTRLILSMLGLLAVACSTQSLLPAATPTFLVPPPQPTETIAVATALPTITPAVTPTPTFGAAPTQPPSTSTGMPTPAATGTALTMAAATVQTTLTPLVQPTPQGPVFESVTTSSSQMQWGNTCTANSITFTAQVATGFNVTSVLLFSRLQSQNGQVTSAWNKALSMHDDGLGTFTYDVSTRALKYYQDYNAAWVQYQLVAFNSQQQEVGRTQIYVNSLAILRCP